MNDIRCAFFGERKKAGIGNGYQTCQQGGNPERDRLEKVGEHVHHLCFTTTDVPGTLSKLTAEGIALAGGGKTYNDPDMTWQKWGWVSPKSAHGVLLEIASPYESHQDGKWHPAAG